MSRRVALALTAALLTLGVGVTPAEAAPTAKTLSCNTHNKFLPDWYQTWLETTAVVEPDGTIRSTSAVIRGAGDYLDPSRASAKVTVTGKTITLHGYLNFPGPDDDYCQAVK